MNRLKKINARRARAAVIRAPKQASRGAPSCAAPRVRTCVLLVACALQAGALLPGTALATGVPTLDEVIVQDENAGLTGTASSSSEGTVTAKQLENRPLLRPAEVLEAVPGLMVSQHSGDGKANQYYLRGFNLDHGTDFATHLMGMPINMPTHAHGQGYTDLNFLIPELVDRIQYRKGTYYAGDGDFSAAGSARIDYVRAVDKPFGQLTLGQRNYQRLLAATSAEAGSGRMLLAFEGSHNDGPWVVPENMRKANLVARYSEGQRDNGYSLTFLGYDAKWTATDQVAQRAVDSGLVGRFGSLDSTTGGNTHRYSASGEWARLGAASASRANAYAVNYALDLWSNFTYFTDPVNGDQFLQSDRRNIVGGNASHTWFARLGERQVDTTVGIDLRRDNIGKVGLFQTRNRETFGTVRDDAVRQTRMGFWAETQVQWAEKFRSTLGLRGDAYVFDVTSNTPANSGRKTDSIASPKLSLVFGPWANTEYYVNAGYGFHSNDARGTVTRINPDPRPGARPVCTDPAGACTGDALSPVSPLVRAKGYELGVRTALIPGLQSTFTLWRLDLDSELLFIGDAGTTEPSRPSRREGIEWANYWTPTKWLLVDADVSLSRARFRGDDPAGNYVPGAIEQAVSVGASMQGSGPWSAGVRLRHFGGRPLIEDNTVRSPSSTLVNLSLAYRPAPRFQVRLDVLNLFGRKVSDIDYYYASQLRGEAGPVNDIHTHPAEPRTLRVTVRASL